MSDAQSTLLGRAAKYECVEEWRAKLLVDDALVKQAAEDWVFSSGGMCISCIRNFDDQPLLTIPPGFQDLTYLLASWCDASEFTIDPEPLTEFSNTARDVASVRLSNVTDDSVRVVGDYDAMKLLPKLWRRAIDTVNRIVLAVGGTEEDITEFVAQSGFGGVTLKPRRQKILDLITQAGCRMQLNDILAGLTEGDIEPSTGVTKEDLSTLVEFNLLNNRKDTRGKGYGLPQWS